MVVEAIVCPYCRELATLREGRDIWPQYPHLADRKVWTCGGCDARVGCHPGTDRPLGSLAGPALRRARRAAHVAFDRWYVRARVKRGDAYKRLAEHLGISKRACHIGMFDVPTCQRVVNWVASQNAGDPDVMGMTLS